MWPVIRARLFLLVDGCHMYNVLSSDPDTSLSGCPFEAAAYLSLAAWMHLIPKIQQHAWQLYITVILEVL